MAQPLLDDLGCVPRRAPGSPPCAVGRAGGSAAPPPSPLLHRTASSRRRGGGTARPLREHPAAVLPCATPRQFLGGLPRFPRLERRHRDCVEWHGTAASARLRWMFQHLPARQDERALYVDARADEVHVSPFETHALAAPSPGHREQAPQREQPIIANGIEERVQLAGGRCVQLATVAPFRRRGARRRVHREQAASQPR